MSTDPKPINRRAGHRPEWLKVRVPGDFDRLPVTRLMNDLALNTVCQEARCPNIFECWSAGTATFMILGDICTRRCTFCAVEGATPLPLDGDEPRRVGEAAARMGLRHVVVTTVTRDDLADGGASHFVAVIESLREKVPRARVEVLTSDFSGNLGAVETVVAAGPDVFNHNVETVPRLYPGVRPEADYARSLGVLARAREAAPEMPTKSGLMVGLGETFDEVVAVLHDLRRVGVDIVTLGQYLRPSAAHLPVQRFVEPGEFDRYSGVAEKLGFSGVASAPFVRSSYHAADVAEDARGG